MRSHLTRNVYRRLLAGRGLLHPCPALALALALSLSVSVSVSGTHCLSQCCTRPLPVSALAPSSASSPRLLVRPPSRRTFLGVFQKPPRELKEPELEPGYDVLLQFRSMETENARPPLRAGLVKGLKQFFQYKKRSRKALNPTQAFLATRLLRHLLEAAPEEDGVGEDISLGDLRVVMDVALKTPKGGTGDHLELARLVYKEIEWRNQVMPETPEGVDISQSPAAGKANGDFRLFINALTKYGGAVEAAERVGQYSKSLQDEGSTDSKNAVKLWTMVLQGLAKEGREEELLSEYQKATEAGVRYLPLIHETMTTFFASRDRVEETKQWFDRPIHMYHSPTPEAYMEAVRFSIRNGQRQWLQPVFEKLLESTPSKPIWDVIFQREVLARDKGVEDIKQMIKTMQGIEGKKGLEPDAATIDLLIMAAIEKKNPYLAERFLSLGGELGIAPRATTYILQMDYRLDAQDFGGAQAIYQKLQNREIDILDDEDLPVLNKYLRLLCAADKPDLERILDITAGLELRRAVLEPETVVALCMVFLRLDQQYDVIDTLSLHTVSYSLEERAQVRRAFVDYCLDTRISTARVWDAYSLLRQFFPETEPEDRIRLMDAFFARKRPDMAANIFGHMRAHGNPAQRPGADIYVRCLEGLGRHPDAASLRMVHNMLKMDTTVQVDTRVRNALMLAHAAAGEPHVALEFWTQIAASTEGPSYNSLAILFWACEKLRVRDPTARAVWMKIQSLDLEVPPSVFGAYCGALAGQGQLAEVKRVIQGMEASVGYSPSVMTLGIVYNALPGEVGKAKFEEWARQEYPELWARLETKGRRQTLHGVQFNIVRDFAA